VATYLLSDFYANKTLDAILGSAHSADFPASVWIGLSTTKPNDDGTGITEPAIGTNAYARVAKTNNDTNWPDAAARVKANGTAITFPAPTGAWAAGAALRFFVLFDEDGTTPPDNHIIYGELAVPRIVSAAGNALSFAIGDLQIYAPTIY
jgi:hypothetical protein